MLLHASKAVRKMEANLQHWLSRHQQLTGLDLTMLQTPPNMPADEFVSQASCLFCSSQAVQDSAVAPLFENVQCIPAAQLPSPA